MGAVNKQDICYKDFKSVLIVWEYLRILVLKKELFTDGAFLLPVSQLNSLQEPEQ